MMKRFRLFLAVTGSLLIVAAISAYFAAAAPRPTLHFVGTIGLALLSLHNTVVIIEKVMRDQK